MIEHDEHYLDLSEYLLPVNLLGSGITTEQARALVESEDQYFDLGEYIQSCNLTTRSTGALNYEVIENLLATIREEAVPLWIPDPQAVQKYRRCVVQAIARYKRSARWKSIRRRQRRAAQRKHNRGGS